MLVCLVFINCPWPTSCKKNNIWHISLPKLFVTETTHNITAPYQLLGDKNRFQSHAIQIHHGGHYSVQVRTAVTDAILTKPVTCSGPDIPAPYELTYQYAKDLFLWKNSPSLPKEILSKKWVLYKFVIIIIVTNIKFVKSFELKSSGSRFGGSSE